MEEYLMSLLECNASTLELLIEAGLTPEEIEQALAD